MEIRVLAEKAYLIHMLLCFIIILELNNFHVILSIALGI